MTELQQIRVELGQVQAEVQHWRGQTEAQPFFATALAELRAQIAALRPSPEKRK